MKPHAFVAVLMTLASLSAACGGSSEQQKAAEDLQKSAEQMQKSSDDLSKGAQDMASGFEAFGKAMAGAMNGGNGDTKPVDPVGFRDLQTVMPDVPGWEKQKPTGERMTAPFSMSQASVNYRKDDASIKMEIMDSGLNQLLFTPFTMFMASGYEKETQDGFERSVNISGNPGWEKWDSGTRNGELNVVVAKRFLVQLEGHDIDDLKALRDVLDRTDLKKLADLK
jgi:hypothetical protein